MKPADYQNLTQRSIDTLLTLQHANYEATIRMEAAKALLQYSFACMAQEAEQEPEDDWS